MYSKMQFAGLYGVCTLRERSPRSSTMMISPGSTSRRNSAPTVLRAHDSDAMVGKLKVGTGNLDLWHVTAIALIVAD